MDMPSKLPSLSSFFAPKPKAPALPSDPGLPSDLLPPAIEAWLHDTATLAGVPPVMTTMPFLAGTGAVIGNRLGLHLQPGWTEYPTLWIALVALTGTGKTPALVAARQPFDLLHTELHAEWQETETDLPFAPLVTTQATWPQLQRLLPHTTGLLLHRDELVGLVQAIDRRAGEDRQRYLSLWSGDVLPDTDHRLIPHPVVSIVGGIQPLLLHRLRSKQQDGLLERFLLVLAGAKTAHWRSDLPPEPDITPMLDILRTLRQHEWSPPVPFTAEAHDLWVTWYNAQIDLTKPAPLILGGFYRKLPVHLARLTLVLHALWHPHAPTQPIARDTLDRAITLVEYLRIQLHRSLVLVNQKHPLRSPADALTDRILASLATHHDAQGWAKRSDIAHHLGDPASSLVTTALIDLLHAGRIEHRTVQGHRGRPADEFRLQQNPRPGENGSNSGVNGPQTPMDSASLDLGPLSRLFAALQTVTPLEPPPDG
jgi:hypothetical protein